MTQAVHVMWGVYGLWLPRCPEGSWQEFVTQWELAVYGQTRSPQLGQQFEPADYKTSKLLSAGRWKQTSQPFSPFQRRAIHTGFEIFLRKHRSTVLACAILPQHVQVVYCPSPLERADVGITLRAEITRQLRRLQAKDPSDCGLMLSPDKFWSPIRWRKDLEEERDILSAVNYVSGLYSLERVEAQPAGFVKPFPSHLGCREERSSYAIDAEWRTAG